MRRNVLVTAVLMGAYLYEIDQSLAQTPPPTALPLGVKVISGQATFTRQGNVLDVLQSSAKLALQWGSFNIGSSSSVVFIQPNSSAIALNQVSSGPGSLIFGSLSANGQIFLVNPAGITFGPTARVNSAGFLASVLQLNTDDFLNGSYSFYRNGASGAIINQGKIVSANNGYVAFLAPQISNQGTIIARLGTVAMAAGDRVVLTLNNLKLTDIEVDPATIKTMIENGNLIMADGGTVLMTDVAANQILGSAINNSGVIEAKSMSRQDGTIRLTGADTISSTGTINVSGQKSGGTIDVTANDDATITGNLTANSKVGTGGTITVTAKTVDIGDGATLSAVGGSGGGGIFVGGGLHGQDPTIAQAVTTTIAPTATLNASASKNGNGGTVVAWSDVTNPLSITTAQGLFLAQGGSLGGNGGTIETSGHYLNTLGASGNASASNGKSGLWIFDPYDITINSTATTLGSFTSGTWTSTGNFSTILNTDIDALLNSGTNVSISTSGAGSQEGVIYVAAPIVKSSGADATLTLQADRDIYVGANITSTSNKLNLVLDANYSGAGGSISVFNGNSVTTNGGYIVMGGGATPTTGYAVGTADSEIFSAVPYDEQRGVNINGTVNAGGGNITINGQGYSGSFYKGVSIGGSVTTSGTGTITLNGIGTLGSPGVAIGDTLPYWNGSSNVSGVTQNGSVTVANGALVINGATSASSDYGVDIVTSGSSINSTGTGSIGLTSTLGGIALTGGISTVNGDITATTSSSDSDIYVYSTITKTGATASSLLLSSYRDIMLKSGAAISSSSGALNTTLQSNNDDTGGGIALGVSSSIVTKGGSLTLAGGSSLTTGYAIGSSGNTAGTGYSGIMLDQVTLSSGGGNIVMRGESGTLASGNQNSAGIIGAWGIGIAGSTINSGTGTISLSAKGQLTSSLAYGHAMEVSGWGAATTITSANTTSSAITIKGDDTLSTSATNGGYGVYLNSSTTISATGNGGGINVTGYGAPASSATNGITVNPGTSITSASGAITFMGTRGNASDYDLYLNSSVTITSGGSTTFDADHVNWAGTIGGTGSLTLTPYTTSSSIGVGASSGATYQISSTLFGSVFSSTLSAIDIGSTTGTGGITVNGPISPATSFGLLQGSGNITLSSAVTLSGSKSLTLESSGTINQTSALTAPNLQLLGTGGTYTLTNSSNSVGTVAGSTGSVTLNDQANLAVGTVQTTGLTTTGSTTLISTGSITLNNSMTSQASSNAVVLEAGTNFINAAGSSGISTPNGRWLVYSTSLAQDTLGALSSGNAHIYSVTPTTLPPTSVTASGNRFLFSSAYTSTTTVSTSTSTAVSTIINGLFQAIAKIQAPSVTTLTRPTIAQGSDDVLPIPARPTVSAPQIATAQPADTQQQIQQTVQPTIQSPSQTTTPLSSSSVTTPPAPKSTIAPLTTEAPPSETPASETPASETPASAPVQSATQSLASGQSMIGAMQALVQSGVDHAIANGVPAGDVTSAATTFAQAFVNAMASGHSQQDSEKIALTAVVDMAQASAGGGTTADSALSSSSNAAIAALARLTALVAPQQQGAFEKALGQALAQGSSIKTAVERARQMVDALSTFKSAEQKAMDALAAGNLTELTASFGKDSALVAGERDLGQRLARGESITDALTHASATAADMAKLEEADKGNFMHMISGTVNAQEVGGYNQAFTTALASGAGLAKALEKARQSSAILDQVRAADEKSTEAKIANTERLLTLIDKIASDKTSSQTFNQALASGHTVPQAMDIAQKARNSTIVNPKARSLNALSSGKDSETLVSSKSSDQGKIGQTIYERALGKALASGLSLDQAEQKADQAIKEFLSMEAKPTSPQLQDAKTIKTLAEAQPDSIR